MKKLLICFWCLDDLKYQTALAEKGKRKIEVTYIACAECQKIFDKGHTIIEIRALPQSIRQPLIFENAGRKYYPTGRYTVVSQRFLDRAIPPELLSEFCGDAQRVYLPQQHYEKIAGPSRVS